MAMKEAQHGKNFILAFRRLKDASSKAGLKLGLQIEHELKYNRDSDSTATKDGAVVTAGPLEVTLELTAISTDDEVNRMLKQSVIDGDKIEVWEIDLASKTAEGKYKALYMQGNLSNWDLPRNVEELVEISTEASIDGVPVEGELTLTEEQENQIAYAFRDLAVVTSP